VKAGAFVAYVSVTAHGIAAMAGLVGHLGNPLERRAQVGGAEIMRFNIYGRFQVVVRRENDSWEVYRVEPGKHAALHDVVIPPTLQTEEVATYLDDIFHELSGRGQCIERLS
jgi:hypothetical protein